MMVTGETNVNSKCPPHTQLELKGLSSWPLPNFTKVNAKEAALHPAPQSHPPGNSSVQEHCLEGKALCHKWYPSELGDQYAKGTVAS